MLILRTKCHSEREAYIEGYKDGAEQALNDSLTDALKVPEVKENGKAIKEMMDKVEEMKAEVPDIAEEAANEEKLYSENLQAVIEKIVNHIDTMKIGKFVVMENTQLEQFGKEVAYSFWEKFDESHTVIRLATSWSTKEEDLESLRKVLSCRCPMPKTSIHWRQMSFSSGRGRL